MSMATAILIFNKEVLIKPIAYSSADNLTIRTSLLKIKDLHGFQMAINQLMFFVMMKSRKQYIFKSRENDGIALIITPDGKWRFENE